MSENDNQVNFSKYKEFVQALVSYPSKDIDAMVDNLKRLEAAGINGPSLLTAGIGLGSEGGEVQEIVKKLIFHSKPYNEDVKNHLTKELGDVMWYFALMCTVLGIDMDKILTENVSKLEARYPGGIFSAWHSENRKEGDI